MRARIYHETVYRYDTPIDYSCQLIRMTPGPYERQRVLDWRVGGLGELSLSSTSDGFGNLMHMLTLDRMHQSATIVATGTVEVEDTHGIVRGAVETLPPSFYLMETPITAPDDALQALARRFSKGGSADARLATMHKLMNGIREAVDYEVGATHVQTTAAEALRAGHGVCQDHAHVFMACARLLGVPARYVSGYLVTGEGDEVFEASHAWAEAHIEDLGWVAFDPANAICATDRYVRVAVGRDYRDAAPTRGVRRGMADEHLEVNISFREVDPGIVSQQ